jgi:hydrogenase maturation protein HypF
MLGEILNDLAAGVPKSIMAARFHRALAQIVCQACQTLRKQYGPSTVALSGGVWQNVTLLRQTVDLLHSAGFTILIHRQVPANDGGLALGQAVVAVHKLK